MASPPTTEKKTNLQTLVDNELRASTGPPTAIAVCDETGSDYYLASARIYELTKRLVSPGTLRNWHRRVIDLAAEAS